MSTQRNNYNDYKYYNVQILIYHNIIVPVACSPAAAPWPARVHPPAKKNKLKHYTHQKYQHFRVSTYQLSTVDIHAVTNLCHGALNLEAQFHDILQLHAQGALFLRISKCDFIHIIKLNKKKKKNSKD